MFEEAMNSGSADQVRAERLVLNKNLETQHMVRIVRAKLRVIRSETIMPHDGHEWRKPNMVTM